MRPERDITKLPKWAQSELRRLERDLASARETLAAGPEDSNTFADPYSTRRPLGADPTILFVLGERDEIRVRVDRDSHGRAYLDVNASSGRLMVHPRSSNGIELYSGPL